MSYPRQLPDIILECRYYSGVTEWVGPVVAYIEGSAEAIRVISKVLSSFMNWLVKEFPSPPDQSGFTRSHQSVLNTVSR